MVPLSVLLVATFPYSVLLIAAQNIPPILRLSSRSYIRSILGLFTTQAPDVEALGILETLLITQSRVSQADTSDNKQY